MGEEELRQVLLIKAMEETDSEGVLVPIADRVTAAREARRDVDASEAPQDALLAARARALLRRVVARHTFVETVLALVGGPSWVRWLLLLLSLVVGFGLSALDGTRRINILSFPLLGLVLWNLAVYTAIAIGAVREAAPARKGRWFSDLIAYAGVAQAARMVARSRAFNVPLSQAIGRFMQEWYESAKPLLVLRATRVLHLCAATVGVGLIVGLYLRGIAFDYSAGWESTFLDPPCVHAVLSILYGPALTLTGITLPDAAHLATIRWGNGGEGENAGRWIHLLAATAAVFVIAPRLLMALVGSIGIRRLSLYAPVPPDLGRYYRTVFGTSGAGVRGLTRVVPYAYEPKPNTLARLQALLAGEHGEHCSVEVQPMIRYGDEEVFLASLRAREGTPPDTLVLLTSLAATPEDENHGALIADLRDWLAVASPRSQFLVIVDEAPYAHRMSTQGGALNRVDERRSVWREFISARGVEAWLADLSP